MFSQVSVILSTIGLMATRLIPITAGSVHILLECFLVQFIFTIKDVEKGKLESYRCPIILLVINPYFTDIQIYDYQ